ncbi:MAG: single-stranded-DNA-specific exonuclease RecJ [Candidatus Omnitrophota bacterium]
MRKTWNVKTGDGEVTKALIKELSISPILATLLANRGITTAKEASVFLNSKLEDLHSPFLFKDMDKAVERIKRALTKNETVLIFGDYDVDGLTATALLATIFSQMGLTVYTYIPDRLQEGYGLSKKSVSFVKEKKISLVVTVDCGISSFSEVELLRQMDVDVIITDHHQPLDGRLPDAYAVIDANRKDCTYPFKYLSGVGVAFKLAEAVCGRFFKEHLDFVCLGTVADVVPLVGENRIFAKNGLGYLHDTGKIGIRSLIEASGLSDKKINETHIGYILGPRINSTGRLSSPTTSLKLLLTDSKSEAQQLAVMLNSENSMRQTIVEKILREALLKIEKEVNFKYHRIIVLDGEGWHQGVIGIVASRVAERFSRPTIIISSTNDICKGSGRSIGNFHLFEAICRCKELLCEYGGHKRAAGFSIPRKNIRLFKDMINAIATEDQDVGDFIPKLDIDMELGFDMLTPELIEELQDLAPFGEENPAPLFLSKNLVLKTNIQQFGKSNIKVGLCQGNIIHEAIGFGLLEHMPSLVKNDRVDLVYQPVINNFRNEKTLQLIIKDIHY